MDLLLNSISAVKPVRFYKIILAETPRHRLMIPRKFSRQYGEGLKDRVLLRVPRGAPWLVDLERDEGEIWLQNGWPEFARFHSLTFGHLLLFEYQGSCNFKVVIFNNGAVEIEYPLTSSTQHANFNIGDEAVLAEERGSGRNDVRPCKNTKANSACKKSFHNGEPSMQNLQQTKTAKASSSKRTVHPEEKEPAGVIRASEEDTARTLTSAKAFISQHPSSFMIKMFPSYVAGEKLGLNVKAAVLKGYISRERINMLVFQIGDKIWHVECTTYSSRGIPRCRLGSGWTQFARDNSLAAGDVCVFEPINQSRKVLKVSIFYAAPVQKMWIENY